MTSQKQPVSVEDLKTRLKVGSVVLWKYRDQVEEGSIVWMSDDKSHIALCWLEGHSSRNDDIRPEEILSLMDRRMSKVEIFPFSGPGLITEAGLREQQRQQEQRDQELRQSGQRQS